MKGEFSKFRWICTIIGLFFSLVDIGSDLLLSVQYFRQGLYIWFALTLVFVLVGSICAQTFSYAWFKDDSDRNGESEAHCIPFLHLLQMGFFTRYYDLLKRSYKCVWNKQHLTENQCGLCRDQRELFGLAADLSMLRLIETFLESVPQLLLQSYIILQHQHTSKMQYISMSVSFVTVAWCTVDYWRCLRRSLPNTDEMPRGIPTVVYLLYKVLTISARILSLTLLIMLNTFTLLGLLFIWLVGTVWAHVVNTSFCTSRWLEELYRGVIGVILIFTFFNVKGKKTRTVMCVYYLLSLLQNLSAPFLLFLFDPTSEISDYFLPVTLFILMSNVAGLGFLIVYYAALHPQRNQSDEVDGPAIITSRTRMEQFLSL